MIRRVKFKEVVLWLNCIFKTCSIAQVKHALKKVVKMFQQKFALTLL